MKRLLLSLLICLHVSHGLAARDLHSWKHYNAFVSKNWPSLDITELNEGQKAAFVQEVSPLIYEKDSFPSTGQFLDIKVENEYERYDAYNNVRTILDYLLEKLNFSKNTCRLLDYTKIILKQEIELFNGADDAEKGEYIEKIASLLYEMRSIDLLMSMIAGKFFKKNLPQTLQGLSSQFSGMSPEEVAGVLNDFKEEVLSSLTDEYMSIRSGTINLVELLVRFYDDLAEKVMYVGKWIE